MNKYILVFFTFIVSNYAFSSAPIETKELTPNNVKELGFSIKLEVSSEATSINIVGPKVVKSECWPSRSGTALMDKDGKELIVHITHLEHQNENPIAFGYFTDKTTTMSVFIDYFCPPGKERESRRYQVNSVAEYLITKVTN